jgi:flagellar hook-associated protein 2
VDANNPGPDAQFTIDGTAATSASNSVRSAIKGMTLNLTAAAIGTPQTLTVSQDTSAASTAQLTNQYQAQFTALNTLMATMNNNSQYLTQLFGGSNSAGALANGKN